VWDYVLKKKPAGFNDDSVNLKCDTAEDKERVENETGSLLNYFLSPKFKEASNAVGGGLKRILEYCRLNIIKSEAEWSKFKAGDGELEKVWKGAVEEALLNDGKKVVKPMVKLY
jgi:hypothetical protein